VEPAFRSAPGTDRGPRFPVGVPSRWRSRAGLQGVSDGVIFDLVERHLGDQGDRDVFPGHAVLAPEDGEELLAGRRLVGSRQLLRERLPPAAHAEATADPKRLHGTACKGMRYLRTCSGHRTCAIVWRKCSNNSSATLRVTPFTAMRDFGVAFAKSSGSLKPASISAFARARPTPLTSMSSRRISELSTFAAFTSRRSSWFPSYPDLSRRAYVSV